MFNYFSRSESNSVRSHGRTVQTSTRCGCTRKSVKIKRGLSLFNFAGCVLVISHDRWFLDRIATHILAAEGDSQWAFFNGNYQEYEADKRKRLGEEGAKPKQIRYKPISR